MTQIRWLGHAGFRLSFPDSSDASLTRVVYFDPWLGNPKLPGDLKDVVPEDADLVLVSHGHFDHCISAPDLIKGSKKHEPKVVCNYEIGHYYKAHHGLTDAHITAMNKGGQVDFGFCTV